MKVILVLCVIFLKYLRFNNVSGELLFLGKGTLSKCQGENCLEHYKSLNRRSLDDIEDAIIGTSEKLSNRQLRRTRITSLKEKTEKMENKIHLAAKNKIKSTIKLNQYHRKKLKKLAKKGIINISSLMKISNQELQKLTHNVHLATNITTSSVKEIMTFVNSSVKKIRSEIEKTGEDVKELADDYWRNIINNANKYINTIRNSSSEDAKKKIVEEAKQVIKKLIYCSSDRLKEVVRNGCAQFTALATSCGTTVRDMSKSNCDRFNSIGNKEERLQKYIDYVCKRMEQLTQHSSDKLYEIAKSCCDYLEQLTQNSIDALNKLADTLNNIFVAYSVDDRQKIEDIEKQIEDQYQKMEHSNEEKYSQMLRNITGAATQLFTYQELMVSNIEKCNSKNPSSCTSSD